MNEKTVRKMVAEYLQLQFPDVIYRFDLAADLKLTAGQAAQHKHLHPMRGYPDLVILEPMGKYHGLAIELKRPNTRIFKKNGDYASDHLFEQAGVLARFREKGYFATFAVGFDDTMEVINHYLSGSFTKLKRKEIA